MEREEHRLNYKREFHKYRKELVKDVFIFDIDEKNLIIYGINNAIGNIKFDDWVANVLNTNTSAAVKYELDFILSGNLYYWVNYNSPTIYN